MCMPQSSIVNLPHYNWDGDFIVHRPIVPSSRPVVGSRKGYDIDVREFLVTTRNEVMRRTLEEDLPEYVEKHMRGVSLAKLSSREVGSFDLRAAVVESFVGACVPYVPFRGKGNDPWQFPDETLSIHRGDCEDRALLIASLLISSGVSSYNVRVALGQIKLELTDGQRTRHDHAWVMYKNEAGRWTVLEPLVQHGRRLVRRLPGKPSARLSSRTIRSAEYVPKYVFNDHHLWGIHQPGRIEESEPELTLRRSWKRIDPQFIGEIHQSIVREALLDLAPQWVADALSRDSITLFGNVVVGPDISLSNYDSLDHFDNGFIVEGWQRVAARLASFKKDNHANIKDFGWAAHAIADFYSHSSYAHFARHDGGYPVPYEDDSSLESSPDYESADFNLSSGAPFTTHKSWKGGPAAAAQAWKGLLISGRYSQKGDSKGFFESITRTNTLAVGKYGALPHHEEIAVDSYEKSSKHVLYEEPEYKDQYVMRELAAIRHVRKAFKENWNG